MKNENIDNTGAGGYTDGQKAARHKAGHIVIRQAEACDFDQAFLYIKKLWNYNTYDRDEIETLYRQILADDRNSCFFAVSDDGIYHGFCHCVYLDTFWMSGKTCYLSGIITNEEDRGSGIGKLLLSHAETLAKGKGCRALILDSGLPRIQAHGFYEHCGYEKSCYGFEKILHIV